MVFFFTPSAMLEKQRKKKLRCFDRRTLVFNRTGSYLEESQVGQPKQRETNWKKKLSTKQQVAGLQKQQDINSPPVVKVSHLYLIVSKGQDQQWTWNRGTFLYMHWIHIFWRWHFSGSVSVSLFSTEICPKRRVILLGRLRDRKEYDLIWWFA